MKGRPAELVGGAGGNGALPRLAAGNHVERLFGYIPHQHHGAEIREKGQFPFQHGEALFNHFLRHRAFPFGPLDGVGDVNAGFRHVTDGRGWEPAPAEQGQGGGQVQRRGGVPVKIVFRAFRNHFIDHHGQDGRRVHAQGRELHPLRGRRLQFFRQVQHEREVGVRN